MSASVAPGQRFGTLTVRSFCTIKDRTQARTAVRCQCDCGRFRVVRADLLRSGRTRSCNFAPCRDGTGPRGAIIEPGTQFGRLTVQDVVYERDKNGQRWQMVRCVCECGRIRRVRRSNLIRSQGATRSCGHAGCRAPTRARYSAPLSGGFRIKLTAAEEAQFRREAKTAKRSMTQYLRQRLGLELPVPIGTAAC